MDLSSPPIYWLVPTELQLLRSFSWAELRHHPWRHATAVCAIALGVALAFAVHLINASALEEFSQAVRSVQGTADLEIRSPQGQFDDAVFSLVAAQAEVALALPVLEFTANAKPASGPRCALRVFGIDVLKIAALSPALLPIPDGEASGLTTLQPNTIFLNAEAAAKLGQAAPAPPGLKLQPQLQLQNGLQWKPVQVTGRIAAGNTPMAVMDIAALQDWLGTDGMRPGQLSRIDLKLRTGVNPEDFVQRLTGHALWPPQLVVAAPVAAASKLDNLSRAYRVNLTVLALVALLTGGFLVYSVLALSVAKRSVAFALLGVLGLTAHQRLRLVLLESAVLGVAASAFGLALGALMAWAALRFLGGDLGGGYFAGLQAAVRWSLASTLFYGTLGVAAAMAGAWWPARQTARLALAQSLKGNTVAEVSKVAQVWPALGWLALAFGLAQLPALNGLPLAAYASVAALVVGGLALLPWLVESCIALVQRWPARGAELRSPTPLKLLALERARRMRAGAGVAVGGVMVSLCLSVALTVMVASFRQSVTQWLNVVLPADLYLRTSSSTLAGQTAVFPPALVDQLARDPGVARLVAQRSLSFPLDPARPNVTLQARPIQDANQELPLIAPTVAPPVNPLAAAGSTYPIYPVYVSEAMVSLYGMQANSTVPQLELALGLKPDAAHPRFYVAGVVRDYARQSGSLLMDLADYRQLTGDRQISDIALWLRPGVDLGGLQDRIRSLAVQTDQAGGDKVGSLIDMATTQEIRATSLRIFDRSFAVTYWLQAVAVGIGLFGVAASFGAQVVARRKEFGLLLHLGLTRRQVRRLVTTEGGVWTAVGALGGLVLGLAVALVLVEVVNPQSFGWTMDLNLPWPRLMVLLLAVVAAGTVTAWLAARLAAGQDAVLAVKDDW